MTTKQIRIRLHALALLAAALIACGTSTVGSSGIPADGPAARSDSELRLTEYDYPSEMDSGHGAGLDSRQDGSEEPARIP